MLQIPSIGEAPVLSLLLKIKDNVDHAGHSLLLRILNLFGKFPERLFLFFLNNKLLIATRTAMDAEVAGQTELSTMLLELVELTLKVHILMKLEMVLADLNLLVLLLKLNHAKLFLRVKLALKMLLLLHLLSLFV